MTVPAAATPGSAALVLARCADLAAHSEEPERLTRRFATPALAAAREAVGAWMRAAGMTVRRDAIGNLIGHYPASSDEAPVLLLGSHLDSVRDAGRYDGPLGVLTALACVERLHASGRRLPYAIAVVGFCDEEGVRYGTPYLGSRALAGTFDSALLERCDADGLTMASAIRTDGGDSQRLAGARWPSSPPLLGYCEVHIEQGPVLEAHGLPVGVVTGIAGQSRAEITVLGVAGHAGTVPIALRHDALCAAAEIILAVERYGCDRPGLVATVGQVTVVPNASNVIPGQVTLSLDVRHTDDAVRRAAVVALRQEAQRVADERGVALRWESRLEVASVACDPALSGRLTRAVERAGYAVHHLPSGAGHDAAVLATLTEVSMLFVRCAGGLSHHPDEAVRESDVAAAIEVVETFLELTATDRTVAPPVLEC